MCEKILVIDDEKDIANLLEVYLQNENYIVYKYYCAKDAIPCIEKGDIDLAILDIMLPDINGFSLCQRIREKYTYPNIMLTAKIEETDKITGLTLGADDYMTKPYATKELIARIHSALRRHEEPKIIVDPAFTIGDLSIYPERHEVRASDEVVDLTKKEFDLLLFLAKNKNRVLKREEILEKVWGYGYAGKTNIVDVYVRYLRSKIDEKVGKKYIHTVRGIGYVARD